MLSHHGFPLFRYGQGDLQSQPKLKGSLGQIKSQVSLDCLTEEDAGVYECVISNGHEKRSAVTELRVASKNLFYENFFILYFFRIILYPIYTKFPNSIVMF